MNLCFPISYGMGCCGNSEAEGRLFCGGGEDVLNVEILEIWDIRNSEDHPKHALSRPLTGASDVRSYKPFSLCFSPIDLGVPTSRKRRYAWYRLVPVLSLVLDEDSLHRHFEEMFFSKCIVGAEIYMTLDDQLLSQYRRHWADLRGDGIFAMFPHRPDRASELFADDGHFCDQDEDWLDPKFIDHLGPFAKSEYRVRLPAFEKMTDRQAKTTAGHCVHIVNVHQNPDRGSNFTSFSPSLLQEPLHFSIPRYGKSDIETEYIRGGPQHEIWKNETWRTNSAQIRAGQQDSQNAPKRISTYPRMSLLYWPEQNCNPFGNPSGLRVDPWCSAVCFKFEWTTYHTLFSDWGKHGTAPQLRRPRRQHHCAATSPTTA